MASANPAVAAAIARAKELRQAKTAPSQLAEVAGAVASQPVQPATELIVADSTDRKLPPQQEQIVQCLLAGFQDYQIADSLGVTQSAIAQMIQQHGLRQIAASRQIGKQTVYQQIDDLYDRAELKLVKQMDKIAGMLTKPGEIAMAIRTVNGAKRRSVGSADQKPDSARVVVLQLPKHVESTFVFNAQNEAISVDGRPLISMPANTLLKKVQGMKNEQIEEANFRAVAGAIAAETAGEIEGRIADYL